MDEGGSFFFNDREEMVRTVQKLMLIGVRGERARIRESFFGVYFYFFDCLRLFSIDFFRRYDIEDIVDFSGG